MSGSIKVERRLAAPVAIGARTVWRSVIPLSLTTGVVLALTILCACGLALRLRGLHEVGFAEDEINKLEAVNSYAQGDITPNAEHPMLMKTLMLISTESAALLNSKFGAQISPEVALRFPNILFGALTVIPLFLLAAALFDRRTAYLTAALWTFGVNAITYNRIGKEDTLLVFFILWALWFYLRAKQTSGFESQLKKRFYLGSAISFGLMFASKYFPQYFGLNMLYHHLYHVRKREPGEPPGRTPSWFYFAIAAAFLIANPAFVLPATWHYASLYVGEQLIKHTGYLLGDTLYKNNMSGTPFGATPLYFYFLFLLVKVPLPVLAAFIAGVVACIRNWRKPAYGYVLLMLVLWFVPYTIAGAKWLRYTVSLLPFLYLAAAVGIVWLLDFIKRRLPTKDGLRQAVSVFVILACVGLPAFQLTAYGAHYALYMNAFGAGWEGYYFPHDELYDDGLREAIAYVCAHAPQNAVIVNETPGVMRYYLNKFGRTDLTPKVLSDMTQDPLADARPTYVILQRGRTYFENRDRMVYVRANFAEEQAIKINAVTAAEVYRRN